MEKVYREIIELAKLHKVKKLVLFGSRARKTNSEKSDIDLAVYGCRDAGLFKDELEEKVWTLLSFDVVNMDNSSVSPELIEEIERDGVILYEEV